MVREVLHIQIGQCGNQIGTKFWENIAQEHGLSTDGTYVGTDPVQLEKIDVYYQETRNDAFVPRAILVDMEKSVLNHVQQKTYGKMFRPSNFCSRTEGAANCFMNGCYSDVARTLGQEVVEVMRHEIERTNCLQGFTYSHSAAGGTGSGLTMQILEKANNLLTKTHATSYLFTVLPSQKISNTVVEPYNCLMVLEKLRNAENVVCLDNESLYKICCNTLGLEAPTFDDMNRLVAMVMAGNTAPFRFPGSINTDLNKLSFSLRARPFLHYYIPSIAPLTSLANQSYRDVSVVELVRQMTNEDNMMVETHKSEIDLKVNEERDDDEKIYGRCINYAALFRGNMSTSEVDESLTHLRGAQKMEHQVRDTLRYTKRMNLLLNNVKSSQLYFENNPRVCFNSITNYAPPGQSMSVTYLRNTSTIKFKFLKIIREAMRMYSTKSFCTWFNEEKAEYGAAKSEGTLTSLEDVITTMSTEWIEGFGKEDASNYPEPLEWDDIKEKMLQED